MAGHYGCERVTTRNLIIAKLIKEKNLLFVKGAVPGPNGGYLIVRESSNQKIPQPPARVKPARVVKSKKR
jgi:large subunit ribosomal protein L3